MYLIFKDNITTLLEAEAFNVILHIQVYSKLCQKWQLITFLFGLLFSWHMKNRPNDFPK